MNTPTCPRRCGRPAIINPMYGVLPCLKCRNEDRESRGTKEAPEFYTQTMQTRVQHQRDEHEADMMPPYDHQGKPKEEYRRAHGEKAKELFSEFERVTGQETELAR